MKLVIPKYADEAAFPREEIKTDTLHMPAQWGLTKREYFAAMAMQGLMAAAAQQRHIPTVVQDSVNLADALLAELEKTK